MLINHGSAALLLGGCGHATGACRRAAYRLAAINSKRLFGSGRSSAELMKLEDTKGALNYAPLPVVLARGKGVDVWDVEGKHYLDFLSGIGAVNQGHCHPKIIGAMIDQCQRLTLTSRAFRNDAIGEYFDFITRYFDFDRVLPANTGVEGGETAVKLARRWAYEVKGVPDQQAKVVWPRGNFWGRTISATSTSTDMHAHKGFGPYLPGFYHVEYNNLPDLERVLASDPHICAYMVEPIQGEAGIVVPDDGYLASAHEICKKYNVLLIADEVQTGVGRTGKTLACDWDNVKPDILILAKGLSGGTYPVSAVLASDEIMLGIKPGQHGSTFGGNPMACRVAMAALEVLRDEGLAENARVMGEKLRSGIKSMESPFVKAVRGRGLLNAVIIDTHGQEKEEGGDRTWNMALRLRDAGLITRPTQGNILRLQPPLCITDQQVDRALEIMESVFSRHP